MEPQELSPALLQPQVTVVAILGELVAKLPSREEMLLLVSPLPLYLELNDFTNELWSTMKCIDDTSCHCNVISDGGDPVTSLSCTVATYKSSPGAIRSRVTMVDIRWQGSVAALEDSWDKLARESTQLCNTCREVATKAADREATATAWARELQDEAARDGTAQENMVELGQALSREEGAEVVAGREAQVRREARVAASEATRATMVRQRLEAALGLLERLVAACDEATAFPRELQRRLRDIEAALEGTNEASPDVPKDLMAKVAVAERLWEANARLAKDHLLGILQDIRFYTDGGPASPSACAVAERCQRAIEDIPRLLRPLERPQGVPKVSPVSAEPQELSPSQLLERQVTVVATLGELVATTARLDGDVMLATSPGFLHLALESFARRLSFTLDHAGLALWHRDDEPPISLGRVLAACGSAPGVTWGHVTMMASEWQGSVAMLEDSWLWLARKAAELCSACRDVATGRSTAVAVRKAMGEAMGEAMGKDTGEAVVAPSQMATMERQRAEAALGLLERLVAACDEATAFPRELRRLLRDIEATLEGTNEASPTVPEALVAQVAEAERLWEASARLARGHLLGALEDLDPLFFSCHPRGPSGLAVAKKCQKAMEDIPRLLQVSDVTTVTSSVQ